MSKVGVMTVEDATQHGKKSLKELARVITEIQNDIGVPVSRVVIMSLHQFERINMLLASNEVFVAEARSITGRMLAEMQRTNPHHTPLFRHLDTLVDLVTGKRPAPVPVPDEPRPAPEPLQPVIVPDDDDDTGRPPEPGELG